MAVRLYSPFLKTKAKLVLNCELVKEVSVKKRKHRKNRNKQLIPVKQIQRRNQQFSYVNLDAVIPSGEVYTEATKGDDVTFRYTVNPEYSLNGNPTFTGVTVSADDRKKGYFKMVIGDSDITVTFPVVKNGKIEVVSNPDVESCKIAINSLKKKVNTVLLTPNSQSLRKGRKVN